MNTANLQSVRLTEDNRLIIIDQTLLPNQLKSIELHTAEDIYNAIYYLKVRGAPAIGICAAYGLYVLAFQEKDQFPSALIDKLKDWSSYLISSRPTAVNLSWALNRMMQKVYALSDPTIQEILDVLHQEAVSIHHEDINMCRAISEYGLSLLKPGDGILTHCNAGPLATSKYGTGQGPFFLAAERDFPLHVYADETRPLLQGARLTSWELQRAGVDVTLICDNMASLVMRNGWIQFCFVGCDRVAANGDVANKIGTSGVAILASYYGIPFYVLGPSSTIDLNCPSGKQIPIEQRPQQEIKELWYEKPMAPDSVPCYNPAFDITDHSLISGIITEKGICRAPYTESLAKIFE